MKYVFCLDIEDFFVYNLLGFYYGLFVNNYDNFKDGSRSFVEFNEWRLDELCTGKLLLLVLLLKELVNDNNEDDDFKL